MKKNSKLVLIGGGGHCKSVLDAVIRSKKFSEIVIIDYRIPAGMKILGCEVIGNDEMLPALSEQGFQNAFITIGSIQSTSKRRDVFCKAKNAGFHFPAIIDPSAIVAGSASIAEGAYIGKNAVVNADAVIGDMAIINTGAIIEHDCRIGEFTHVAVGATVCGGAEIEEDVLIGANAAVIQGVEIGHDTIVAAGAVVNKDLPPNCTAVGVPAKIVKYHGHEK